MPSFCFIKKNFLCFLFVTASAGCFAQQTQTTYYDAAKKVRKESFSTKTIGGKPVKHGPYRIYYENSKLWQEGNYRNDTLVGEWTVYFPNGLRKQTVTYKNGLRNGKSFTFYEEDGSLYQELIYLNDLLHGKIITLYPNGKYLEVSEYSRDTLVNESKGFHENGKIAFIRRYANGKKNGKLKYGMCRIRVVKSGYLLKIIKSIINLTPELVSPYSSTDRTRHS